MCLYTGLGYISALQGERRCATKKFSGIASGYRVEFLRGL